MYSAKQRGRSSAGRQSADVLVRALAERVPDIENHMNDVATLAAATAQRLGLEPDEIELVHRAAALHDIGKVAIPDAILRKPGPLDPDEWAFMRRHPTIGERILAAAPFAGTGRGAGARLTRTVRRSRLPRRPRSRTDPTRGANHLRLRCL